MNANEQPTEQAELSDETQDDGDFGVAEAASQSATASSEGPATQIASVVPRSANIGHNTASGS